MTTTQTTTAIQSVNVTAKQWFDKVNGNSYFSAQIVINAGLPTQQTICVPFQYGYGSAYEYAAFKKLQELGFIRKQDNMCNPYGYFSDNNIPCSYTKIEKCLKREVIAWGK
jgi:hypothetical protein